MPDLFGWHQERWVADVEGSAQAFVSQATSLLLEDRGRLRTWRRSYAELEFGSRASYRFWGFMASKRTVPVVVRITAQDRPEGRASGYLWLLSNPGWYLGDYFTGLTSWIYQRAFAFRRAQLARLGDFEIAAPTDPANDPFNLPPETAEDIVTGFLLSVTVEPGLDDAVRQQARSALSALGQGSSGTAAGVVRDVVAYIRSLPREDGARRLAQRPLDQAVQELGAIR
ncbi:MAG TPA: hypothetical protein VHB02_01045 [Acidimicrobiales bacterium]|nr:hypothetical protein [Acidimicrobiales bacterium]